VRFLLNKVTLRVVSLKFCFFFNILFYQLLHIINHAIINAKYYKNNYNSGSRAPNNEVWSSFIRHPSAQFIWLGIMWRLSFHFCTKFQTTLTKIIISQNPFYRLKLLGMSHFPMPHPSHSRCFEHANNIWCGGLLCNTLHLPITSSF
jgi:hypothetical protein